MQILDLLAEARKWLDFVADVVRLVDDFLRGFLIVPESFAGHLRFEFGKPLVQFGDVKETSAGEKPCRRRSKFAGGRCRTFVQNKEFRSENPEGF